VPLLTGRDHIDTLVRDDPRPGLSEIWERALERRLARVRRLGSPLLRTLNLQSPRRSWKTANSILFLCKGNICRSPFAEELAKSIWPEKRIESAGTYPDGDRPSPPHAIEAANEFGIKLERKRSRVASAKLFAQFERIVIFDDEQAAWLRTHYPDVMEKVDYLDNAIIDPFGGELQAFHACYGHIAKAIAGSHFYSPSRNPARNPSLLRALATKTLGEKFVCQLDEYRGFLRVRRMPDRVVLQDVILPYAARQGGKILWIGCRRYTMDYPAVLEQFGAECWSTDIDPVVVVWGRAGRHRTGDIREASGLFPDMRFQTILCNGMFGFGIDTPDAQRLCLAELAKIAVPDAALIVGWNTDKTLDPVATGLIDDWFVPDHTFALGARYSCPGSTHVYDFLRRRRSTSATAEEDETDRRLAAGVSSAD
jgi:protein-tyrosine-phosphatase